MDFDVQRIRLVLCLLLPMSGDASRLRDSLGQDALDFMFTLSGACFRLIDVCCLSQPIETCCLASQLLAFYARWSKAEVRALDS